MLYELHVWCRRNGVSSDAGKETEGEFGSDQEAVDAFRNQNHPYLYAAYDEIFFTVRSDEGEVGRWTWVKPLYPSKYTNCLDWHTGNDK